MLCSQTTHRSLLSQGMSDPGSAAPSMPCICHTLRLADLFFFFFLKSIHTSGHGDALGLCTVGTVNASNTLCRNLDFKSTLEWKELIMKVDQVMSTRAGSRESRIQCISTLCQEH